MNPDRRPVVHLMFNSIISRSYIDFADKYGESGRHRFYILKGAPQSRVEIPVRSDVLNVRTIADGFRMLLDMHRAELIILHSLFMKNLVRLLAFMPRISGKCVWAVWGGDLYGTASHDRRMTPAYERTRRRVIRRFRYIVTGIRKDYEAVRDRYQTSACYVPAAYPNQISLDFMDDLVRNSPAPDGIFRILVGNSATATNRHAEAFRLLEPFRHESLELIVPLNYGENDYKESVIREGRRIFGDKFRPVTDFMSLENYLHMLNRADAALMVQNRQQGVTTIRYLMYLGKKVYLNREVSSWDHFRDQGFVLFPSSRLEKESFEDFSAYDTETKMLNRKTIRDFYLNNIKRWQKLFEDA